MRVAVISDIHGNAHALEAVLQAIAEETVDALWCLGDVVGYGPKPNECCAAVQEHADLCLAGNHDLAVLGALDLFEFSPDAAESAAWTRSVLSDSSRAFLASLATTAAPRGLDVALAHASPRDPVWEYVLTAESAADALLTSPARVVLVGHSHVALGISLAGDTLAGGHTPDGTEADLSEARWLINPGSVGQPRDGDPRAAFVLLDLTRGFAKWRRVTYRLDATQHELRASGLPESLAARLEHGV